MLPELMIRAYRAISRSAVLQPHPLWSLLRLCWCWLRFGTSLYTLVAWNALRFGPETALAEARSAKTYHQLQRDSEQLAARLFRNFGRARTVGILCQSHLGYAELLLACGRLGLEAVLLNTSLTAGQLKTVHGQRPLDLIICDLEFAPRVQDLKATPGGPQVVLLSDLRQPENPLPARLPTFFRRSAGRITVLTSGTTGPPKLVRRTIGLHEALGTAVGLLEALKPRQGQPVLLTLPLLHGHGLATLALSLAMGSPLYLSPKATQEMLECIEAHRIEVLVLVPTLLYRLLEHLQNAPRPYRTDCLKAVISGSAPLEGALASRTLKELGPVLYNLYGSSETGILSLATPEDLKQHPRTVGRALPGVCLQVWDGQTPVGPQEVGQVVVVRGKHAFFTGDLGYFDTRGRLFLQGRADDMLICGGQNLYPESYESAVLEALDYLAECAVSGISDPEYGQALRLWVVLKPNQPEIPLSQIENELARLFPRTLRPRQICWLEALPRNHAGKVLRQQLTQALCDSGRN